MKSNFLSTIGAIALIGVIAVVGLWALNQVQQLTPPVANIPGADAQAAATRISEATLTPGPGGQYQVATLIPLQDVYLPGDEVMLHQSLAQIYASAGFDFRISTEVVIGAEVTYCTQAFIPNIGSDPSDPVMEQAWQFIPGTRYCVSASEIGSIYGGVHQSDLQSNILIEALDNPPILDPEARTVTHTQSARVTITARMGVFTQAVQLGNISPNTIDDPAEALRAFIDFSKGLIGDDVFFQEKIDTANTLVLELLQWELLAPLQADGTRSTVNLDRLYQEVVRQFTQSSYNQTNPWPYDNLLWQADLLARDAGYTGCGELIVRITMPFADGGYYYLQGMNDAPQLVIPTDHLTRFQNNLYWYYTDLAVNEVPDRGTPLYVR